MPLMRAVTFAAGESRIRSEGKPPLAWIGSAFFSWLKNGRYVGVDVEQDRAIRFAGEGDLAEREAFALQVAGRAGQVDRLVLFHMGWYATHVPDGAHDRSQSGLPAVVASVASFTAMEPSPTANSGDCSSRIQGSSRPLICRLLYSSV